MASFIWTRWRLPCKHMLSLARNENSIDIVRHNILTDEMMPPKQMESTTILCESLIPFIFN